MLIKVPDYLTRYYKKGENPFLSLNDLPYEQANQIKLLHCKEDNIGGFYSEDDYLIQRREIEKWIYHQLVQKGGNPTSNVPIYMTLGDSPSGEYDIRSDLQKNAAELIIPLECLDLSAITFTFPDSMYQIILDENGQIVEDGRTNTPRVYLFQEIKDVLIEYQNFLHDHYIEAQVWNREMLYAYYNKQNY